MIQNLEKLKESLEAIPCSYESRLKIRKLFSEFEQTLKEEMEEKTLDDWGDAFDRDQN